MRFYRVVNICYARCDCKSESAVRLLITALKKKVKMYLLQIAKDARILTSCIFWGCSEFCPPEKRLNLKFPELKLK